MKKLIIFVTCLVSTLLVNAQAPTFEWAKNMGGLNGSGSGNAIAVYTAQYVYSTGNFRGKTDFDPGAGTLYLTSAGGEDIFISKSNSSGTILWAKQLGGTGVDLSEAIAVDGSGNVYTTGNFNGTVDFDPGAGIFNLTSAGSSDIFVSKLDASGNFVWAKRFGGTSLDYGVSIAVDNSANVYTTGYFSLTGDFDPGPGIFNLTSAGATDIFVSKLDASGNFIWTQRFGASTVDNSSSVALDASGNVYVSGIFAGTVDFDPGSGTFNMVSVGTSDIFLLKLNTSGNFVWAKKFGGIDGETGMCCAVDVLGNIYTSGYFWGTVDFDPGAGITNLISAGGFDGFISKLDASGNFVWAKQMGGTSNEIVNAIALDGSSNVYAIGYFSGTTDFDPGPNVFNLTSLNTDIFISKLNASGNFVWAKSTTTTSSSAAGSSIAVNSSGNIYYAGDFGGKVDFDPGVGTLILNDPSNDHWPVFSQLDNMGNLVWVSSPGLYSDASGIATSMNLSGEIVVAGHFLGTVDFDPGAGIFNMTTDPNDTWGDIFILKTNASGNLIWSKKVSGISDDYARSVKTDASGNIYVTGYFRETTDFDPGVGTFNLTSAGSDDIFILKLDANGNFVWAKKIGNSGLSRGNALDIDASGNIYITGYFSGTLDFDPGAGIVNLISVGDNAFVAKYDASGNLIWAKQTTGTSGTHAYGMTLDNNGNVYCTGYFYGTVDFDPGAGTSNLTSAGDFDAFIYKLDGSGNFVWAKQLSGVNREFGSVIKVDGAGNVYTAGYFTGISDFDPGPGSYNLTTAGYEDIFISKLNASGNFVWAKQIGSSVSEYASSIALDASANIYISGSFTATTDFDPGLAVYNLTWSGYTDGYVTKLDAAGNFVWAEKIGGPGMDGSNSIVVDASFNLYTTGYFHGTVDFDPGAGVSNLTNSGYEVNQFIGGEDLFIQKLSQCAPPSAIISPAGPIGLCTGGSVTLNATTAAGITYQWKKNGVSISGATSSSYVATTTGSYTCTLTNACGVITSTAIQVTVFTAVPATPGSITTTGGVVKVCPGETRTYSVVAIAGVTYTWTPCAGSTITSGQSTNSVTVQYNAGFPASDTIRVVATNSCGNSAQRKLKISRNTPGTPASIVGDYLGVCNLSGKPYSVTNVTGMTYAWSFNTGTATVASGQGTSNITANYAAGFVSGVLSVTAGNGCGTSAARVKTIYAKPATPVSITGATSVCLNQQNVPYSIAPLANVTNYTWTGPTGSHISDGVTTSAGTTLVTTHTSVTVNYATTAGSVKVRGNNACASGSYKSLAVAIVCREGEFSNAISETRIYPNPTAADFTLETDDTSNPFDLEVYDAYGKLIFSETNLNSGYQVKTNGWADGLYSVVIRKGEKITTLKLVIQE